MLEKGVFSKKGFLVYFWLARKDHHGARDPRVVSGSSKRRPKSIRKDSNTGQWGFPGRTPGGPCVICVCSPWVGGVDARGQSEVHLEMGQEMAPKAMAPTVLLLRKQGYNHQSHQETSKLNLEV